MYRTSIKGRRDLANLLFQDSDSNAIQKIDSSYTSRVAEIFDVILKSLSIGLDFVDEDDAIYPLNNTELKSHELDGRNYFCTDYQFFIIQREKEIREEILEENPVITKEELEKRIKHEMKTRNYLMGPSYDEETEQE
jgi:hypothetical protein